MICVGSGAESWRLRQGRLATVARKTGGGGTEEDISRLPARKKKVYLPFSSWSSLDGSSCCPRINFLLGLPLLPAGGSREFIFGQNSELRKNGSLFPARINSRTIGRSGAGREEMGMQFSPARRGALPMGFPLPVEENCPKRPCVLNN